MVTDCRARLRTLLSLPLGASSDVVPHHSKDDMALPDEVVAVGEPALLRAMRKPSPAV